MKNLKTVCFFLTIVSSLNGSIALDQRKKSFQNDYATWLERNNFEMELYCEYVQNIISNLYVTSILNRADQQDFVCDQDFIDDIFQDIVNINYLLLVWVKKVRDKNSKQEISENVIIKKILKDADLAASLSEKEAKAYFNENQELLHLLKIYKIFDKKYKLFVQIF